jgi:hyperosmotically inducible periplasmic protein
MMRSLTMQLSLLAVLGGAVVGCQATTGRTTGEYIDDAAVTTAVKTKLTGDKASNFTRIDVDTRQGTVYLTGIVKDPETKSRAVSLAGQVNGVRKVVDNLQVENK